MRKLSFALLAAFAFASISPVFAQDKKEEKKEEKKEAKKEHKEHKKEKKEEKK